MARQRKKPERSLQWVAKIDRVAAAGGRPAGQLSIAVLEEMILRAAPAMRLERPGLRAIVREGLTALCKAWTAHTLKRVIADVACTSEEDYREFGLDKTEILTALSRLSAEIEVVHGKPWGRGAMLTAAH